ncbi:MAG: hypothetical protein M3N52_00090 [Actinomycetota bacterium]|nr:hypothetical protein [Actinomycetota bacterium]
MTLLESAVRGWRGHGLSHLIVAALLGLLLLAVLRRWPAARRTPPGRLARRMVVFGLGGVVGGQLLEVLGARVDEPGALWVEELAHTAGQVLTMIALIALLVGAVLSLLAGARERAVPWWVVGVVAVVCIGLLVVAFIGVPSGSDQAVAELVGGGIS